MLLGFLGFAVALIVQLCYRWYSPRAYWVTVAMVGIFGTMAADVTHITMKLGYRASVALFRGRDRRSGPRLPVRLVELVACFWAAYTVTRPLGAALAAWLGGPVADGGRGGGSGVVGIFLAVAVAGTVAVVARRASPVEASRGPREQSDDVGRRDTGN